MTVSDRRFELDKAFTYRALQDARQYVTDFDPTGRKAEVLYQRLARASRLMQPWSTDGAAHQASKANEYLREVTSILSDKIGPASRREFRDQGGTRHATKKSSAQPSRRDLVLTHMRIAGHDGDRKAWTRLYVENKISIATAEAAWQAGVRARKS